MLLFYTLNFASCSMTGSAKINALSIAYDKMRYYIHMYQSYDDDYQNCFRQSDAILNEIRSIEGKLNELEPEIKAKSARLKNMVKDNSEVAILINDIARKESDLKSIREKKYELLRQLNVLNARKEKLMQNMTKMSHKKIFLTTEIEKIKNAPVSEISKK